MTPLLQPVQDLRSEAICAVRAALLRGALVGAALLVATLGAAFLVFSGYVGLRLVVGPGLAALILGLVLLTTAAGLLLVARKANRTIQPVATSPPPGTEKAEHPAGPADITTIAIFTSAFVLGRQLADRRRRSGNF